MDTEKMETQSVPPEAMEVAQKDSSESEVKAEKEKYYADMYARVQYRKSYGAKCAKLVEKMHNHRLQSIEIDHSSGVLAYNDPKEIASVAEKLKECLAQHEAYKKDNFFSHTLPNTEQMKSHDMNLEVQRLYRQSEELKVVLEQQENRKKDATYKLLDQN